ncbi:AraC family transcriptional regulator [Asticcacaulis machinosus]|uniref:AraC family transcriptional regulator n=1 Tax=Asticcacaulis machinosus TaxID=2984211 RepID=A0ABT5HH09_9CAUL|nr:AraC family transcriptional regulator [Asticcacaulis machinosus]MDC7675539.1 AraC family transcriptional regulator [Asticcacaulis machinosus]
MDKLTTLTDLLSRHIPQDGIHACPLPGVKLIRSSAPTMPMPVVYEPTLCLIAQGRKQAVLGTTAFVYDPANYLVASVDLPVMGSVIEATTERPYLCVQIDLNMAVLSDLVIQNPAIPTAQNVSGGLVLNRTTPELLDAMVRLIGLLDSHQDIAVLAPLAIREILYRLLTGGSGSLIRKMAQADSRMNQIARAIVWIRTRFRESCPIDQAADIAGMSRSTFHAHFKSVTLMSPLEFRTLLRVQEAQRLMVSDAKDAASAGFIVGYASPSHFSRDYARIFGMPPATHADQLRSVLTS